MSASMRNLASSIKATSYLINLIETNLIFPAGKMRRPPLHGHLNGSGKTYLAISTRQAMTSYVEHWPCYRGGMR